ncbi:MAG: DUF4126 family protein [Pyrinomonadaceae bacterium]|nr:DUF4126 family protein [Pyrinomonadaceae bacterium]
MNRTKDHTDYETFVKVIYIGAVAGLRAMMPLALLSFAASQRENNKDDRNFFVSKGVSAALGLLAVGELVGDKLPTAPNRTEPAGLAARIVSGAIGGGVICSARKKSVPLGIALGALAAVAAAYAGQNIRRAIAKETGIHSSLLGVVEDAIAIGIGASAVKD